MRRSTGFMGRWEGGGKEGAGGFDYRIGVIVYIFASSSFSSSSSSSFGGGGLFFRAASIPPLYILLRGPGIVDNTSLISKPMFSCCGIVILIGSLVKKYRRHHYKNAQISIPKNPISMFASRPLRPLLTTANHPTQPINSPN